MRVVAGVARGRVLQAPKGRTTRPTSDRVREAIFSMLTSLQTLEGVSVLDLFAGSGALGIEALSRGAARAVLVESDREAIEVIEANLAGLGELRDRAVVIRADVWRYLDTPPAADLVLADPPYRFDRWPELLARLHDRCETLVAETGSGWDPGPTWETVKVKKYGDTVVTVARPIGSPARAVADASSQPLVQSAAQPAVQPAARPLEFEGQEGEI